ncbi:MAG: hypothetical protein P4L84_00485 [Isosphaeraceae bacterium]|nr:hypothetical protein [Isosphaeraceae bacterium]
MSQELHYTSAPRGLWPGSQGYCTVACTAHMPSSLAERLEGLSAYRNIFPPHDPRATQNPVVLSHLRVMIAGASRHVVSRVGFAGLDYTERANKYAHHVVLDPSELPTGGPAWLLGQPGFLRAAWDGNVGWIDIPHPVPRGDVRPSVCRAWQQATGDAGWAGVLAETFLAGSRPVTYLIHEPGQDVLPLILEAQLLLPPERRWDLTFSTYFTTLPQGVVCAWRGVVRGTPEEAQSRRAGQTLVLDLWRPLGQAPDGPLVEQARTGRLPVTRLGREAAPPSLPAEQRLGADEAIVLRSVPAAGVYGVVPELPQPPALLQPLRSREWSGTPWPRRARAVVAVVCLLFFTVGGLAAWQILKPRKRRNVDQVAQTGMKPGSGLAGRQDQISQVTNPPGPDAYAPPSSRKAPPFVGSSEEQTAGAANRLAIAGPRPPNADIDKAKKSPAGEVSFSEKGRANDQEPQKSEATRSDSRDRKSSFATAEKSGNPTRIAQPVPKMETSKSTVELLWVDLPPVSDFSEPEDFELPPDIEKGEAVSLELKGLRDPTYSRFSLKAVPSNPDSGTGLRILSDVRGKTREVAGITLKDRRLFFRWGKSLIPSFSEHVLVVRSCVLEVRGAGKEPLKRVVLRRRAGRSNPISMNQLGTSQTIDWGNAGRPFGRELRIGECKWTNARIGLIDKQEDPRGRARVFRLESPDGPSLRLDLVQPTKVDSRVVDNLVMAFDPSEQSLRADAVELLRQLEANNPSLPPVQNRDEREQITSKFGNLQGIRHDCLMFIRGELAKSNFKTINIMNSIDTFNTNRLAIKNLVRDPSWEKQDNLLCDGITTDIRRLERIRGLRTTMLSDQATLSVSVVMMVDSEPVEIASLGIVRRSPENEKPGPESGVKR